MSRSRRSSPSSFLRRPAAIAALAALLGVAAPIAATAATIRVPADQPTVQAAVDAAADGDTVVVGLGTWPGPVVITRKSIDLVGEDGIGDVTLVGPDNDAVVRVDGDAGDPAATRVSLRHLGLQYGRTGFSATNADVVLDDLRVVGNTGCDGGGIALRYGRAELARLYVSNNGGACVRSSYGGGGVFAFSLDRLRLVDSIVSANASPARGGGVLVWSSRDVVIDRTRLQANRAATSGGGLSSMGSWVTVTNTLVTGNRAASGGGLAVDASLVPGLVANDTLADNEATVEGSELLLQGLPAQTRFANNVFHTTAGTSGIACRLDRVDRAEPPVFDHNHRSSVARLVVGDANCVAALKAAPDLHGDPRLRGSGREPYAPRRDSPLLEAGDAGLAASAGPRDVAGHPRVQDGDGDGAALIDIGAYEGRPPATAVR